MKCLGISFVSYCTQLNQELTQLIIFNSIIVCFIHGIKGPFHLIIYHDEIFPIIHFNQLILVIKVILK